MVSALNTFRLTHGKAFVAFGILASAFALSATPEAHAQGAFLIYGNFCGPGNRGPGFQPIDALDLACAHHDACSPDADSGLLPRCSCNRRLLVESSHVARDPQTPQQTRDMAVFIANFAGAAPCQ